LSDLGAYMWVVLGVIVAVILPVLAAYIKKQFPTTKADLPPWLKRYGALLIFSMIVALVSLAIWKGQNPTTHPTWFTAFLIGFGWESAIEKFLNPVTKPVAQADLSSRP
jgi:hypothetical protein